MSNASFSKQLSTFAFLATLMVVVCHCDDYLVGADFFSRFVGGVFTDSNVSNFFFLSGFLIARHAREEGWYLSALEKRFRTIAIPYFLWNLIVALFFFTTTRLGLSHTPSNLFRPSHVWGLGFFSPPMDFPLWYLKTLVYFIVVAPPFFAILKRYRWMIFPLITLLLAISGGAFARTKAVLYGFPPVGFAAFLFGAYIAIWDGRLKSVVFGGRTVRWFLTACFGLFVWVALALVIDRLLSNQTVWGRFAHGPYVLLAVFCLSRIVANIPWRVPESLTRSTFVIYATHYICLPLIVPYVGHIMGPGSFQTFLSCVLIVVLAGVLLTECLRIVSMRALSILTGGRG